MFRKMRRFKQELSLQQCQNLLISEKRGVLSVNGDNGYPYGIPLDYYYDIDDNCLYFHGAKQGHKIDAINRDNRVCFTVYNQGIIKENDWAYTCESVIVFGTIELINDIKITEEKVRLLAEKYYPSKEEIDKVINSDLNRVQLLKLNIQHISGKTIHEQ